MTACNVNRVTRCSAAPPPPQLNVLGCFGIFWLIVLRYRSPVRSALHRIVLRFIAQLFFGGWGGKKALKIPQHAAFPACNCRRHLAGIDWDINQREPISLLGKAGAPCVWRLSPFHSGLGSTPSWDLRSTPSPPLSLSPSSCFQSYFQL